MLNVKPILPSLLADGFVGEGIVTLIKPGSAYCGVSVTSANGVVEALAYIAQGISAQLNEGDKVLCVVGAERTLYATTVLQQSTISDAGAPESTVKVFNKRQELIFEYDPETDRSRVFVDGKNLEIDVPDGDIQFRAGGTVNIDGAKVRLAAGSQHASQKSAVELTPFKAVLHAPIVDLKSRISRLVSDEVTFRSNKLTSSIASAKIIWGKVEIAAEKMVSRMKSRYSTIEEVDQIKAGRLRRLIKGSYRLKAERVNMKTDRSVNIDGERINLG